MLTSLSCGSDDKKGDDKKVADKGSMLGESASFKMNCVILTKAQVQAWVDSGWTTSGDPNKIKTLLFQLYSADAAGASDNMQLTVYPGKSVLDVKINGRTNLTIDTTCVALPLTGQAILANNVINLRDLKILKADGTLNDFDFIRLRPVKGSDYYLAFAVEVVKMAVDKETYLFKGDTYPCPPHCPPPPPDDY